MKKRELFKDFEIAYNAQMSQVYRIHREIPSAELRGLYLTWVAKHIVDKTILELNKKNNPNRKINKILKIMEAKQKKEALDALTETIEKWEPNLESEKELIDLR